MRSGVAIALLTSCGTLLSNSFATDFSDAGGIFVAPSEGAPGWLAGSDMVYAGG